VAADCRHGKRAIGRRRVIGMAALGNGDNFWVGVFLKILHSRFSCAAQSCPGRLGLDREQAGARTSCVDYSFRTTKEGVLVLYAGGGRLAVSEIGTHSSVMGGCVWVVLFWDGTSAER
jgi:hypothetical protein